MEKTSGGTILAQVTFTYDALDNRIGMDENGTQTWTLYDGDTPVMDFNGSGSLTMRYMWGPTGIVARQTSGGTVSWYLADRLGTVRDLINNSGAIIDHVDFSAFGTVLGESSPSSGDRFVSFAGLERDTVTGLNLAIEREENPGTGRWDSQDPLGFAAGDFNLDRYVGNQPATAADPAGESDEPVFGGRPFDPIQWPTDPVSLPRPPSPEQWQQDPRLRQFNRRAWRDVRRFQGEQGFWVLWDPDSGRVEFTRSGFMRVKGEMGHGKVFPPRDISPVSDDDPSRKPGAPINGYCIIGMVHTHPGGSPTPSGPDMNLRRKGIIVPTFISTGPEDPLVPFVGYPPNQVR